jgi:hypothetical protein
VRRRTRPQILWVSLAALVTAALVVAVVVTVRAWPGAPGPRAAGGSWSAPQCPATVETGPKQPIAQGEGDLVPPTAVDALLCVYSAEAPVTLQESRRLPSGKADEVVSVLNGMPSRLEPQGDETPGGGCFLLARSPFLALFGYSDRPPVTVEIDANCGTVRSDNGYRYLTSLKRVLAFWGLP